MSDEIAFSKHSSELEGKLRSNPAVHFVVFANSKPKEMWERLKIRYPEIANEEDSYFAESADFSHCSFPLKCTPGAYVSSIRYPVNDQTKFLSEFSTGENTIFGITGFKLISDSPDHELAIWFSTLVHEWQNARLNGDSITNGFQSIECISKQEFQDTYGGWDGPSMEYNRIGVVKLGAEDLSLARAHLEKAGFDVTSGSRELIVKKDMNTGLSFLIEAGCAKTYFKSIAQLA